MAMSWRYSEIANRHRALGSKLEDWNGMGMAWTYASDLNTEHAAIRTKAGLMDVSGLKKLHVVGPHSHAILQYATTRDVTKIYPGRSAYSCMLNERGMFTDDCILYRTGPNAWMIVHGSGSGHEELQRQAIGKNVSIEFDDDLHDLSLQGPIAVEFLAKHVPGIRSLPYFHHLSTTLFGAPVTISRTGYTGERGYEIFCKREDAGMIWDAILGDGKAMGIIPCSFTVLDWLRVESSLMFYPYDNSEMYPYENELPGDTLWELGLDFTVSPGKTGFRGAEEHYRRKGKERVKIFGVLVDGTTPPDAGDALLHDGQRAGVVTCAMHSKLSGKTMGIARLEPNLAIQGVKLQVRGKSLNTGAIAHALPFDDPEKRKRVAVG